MERPKIKDYFSEDTTIQMINNLFLEQPELYAYIEAQDSYVDSLLASQPKVDIQQSCEHCKHFTLNTYEDNYKSEMGNCKYQVKFPDSTYARCAGTKKTMNKRDGRNCPCYEAI